MDITPNEMWDNCLAIIRDNITPEQFATSFAYVKLNSFEAENGKLVLDVPSNFIKEHLETHYIKLMKAVFKKIFGNNTTLYYNVAYISQEEGHVTEKTINADKVENGPARVSGNKTPDMLTAPQVQDLDSQLFAEYNFNTYIEGESNRLARSVGESIAIKPAKTFNPLFVYGPSGCGKTHLINAIGLRAKELHPEMRVLYLSAHLFEVQYRDAVKNNKVPEFILFYQTIDILILDDVQELSGKKSTQNTFFHIFNHLQLNGKQIILAADRPPIAIEDLEDRLLTRFKWGLQAEIEKPTKSLRLEILNAKVNKDGLQIPENVLKFISDNLDESVRDLEGMLNSLLAYSVVYNCPVDMKLVKKVMPRFVDTIEREISIDDIKEAVCEHFNMPVQQLDSRIRTQNIAYARMLAMYLSSELTNKPNTQIGQSIGNRNHATVIHAIKHIQDTLEIDANVKKDIENIKSLIINISKK